MLTTWTATIIFTLTVTTQYFLSKTREKSSDNVILLIRDITLNYPYPRARRTDECPWWRWFCLLLLYCKFIMYFSCWLKIKTDFTLFLHIRGALNKFLKLGRRNCSIVLKFLHLFKVLSLGTYTVSHPLIPRIRALLPFWRRHIKILFWSAKMAFSAPPNLIPQRVSFTNVNKKKSQDDKSCE